MEANTSSSKNDIRAITILFYALTAGIVLFAGVSFAMTQFTGPRLGGKNVIQVLKVVAGVMALSCFIIANTLYKKRMQGVTRYDLTVQKKFELYKAALIVYLALCEAPALFSITVFFLTSNKIFLAIAAAMLLAMFLKKPEKSKIINELQLDSKEQMELN